MAFPHFTKTHHATAYPAIDPSRPELSAAGKTILITGGGAGIGLAAAQAFARAGAEELILVGRRADVLERAKADIGAAHPSTRVRTGVADISDAHAVDALFADGTGIDVLVSNAAVQTALEPFASTDFDSWWRGFEINVRGPALLVRGFLRVAKPGAVIVNVTTAGAHVPGMPRMSNYQATKAGALKFFEVLQAEHPELQIVNVHPGVIETDMSRQAYGAGFDFGKKDDGVWLCGCSRTDRRSEPGCWRDCVGCEFGGRVHEGQGVLGKLGR